MGLHELPDRTDILGLPRSFGLQEPKVDHDLDGAPGPIDTYLTMEQFH